METKEYRTIDKSEWPRGEWINEPDKKQWTDEETGLPCLIVRTPWGGNLCGYVGVTSNHPFHGKEYSVDGLEIEVHGGLTFASGCASHSEESFQKWRTYMIDSKPEAAKYPQGDAARRWKDSGHLIDDYAAWCDFITSRSICHIPGEGEPDSVWWFGFDCAHAWDISPATDRNYHGSDSEYRDFDYVTRECQSLARQLAALA